MLPLTSFIISLTLSLFSLPLIQNFLSRIRVYLASPRQLHCYLRLDPQLIILYREVLRAKDQRKKEKVEREREGRRGRERERGGRGEISGLYLYSLPLCTCTVCMLKSSLILFYFHFLDSKKLRTKSVEGSSSHPEEVCHTCSCKYIKFYSLSLFLSSQNLKQLQVHKSNIFELSLPNRVTKVIEARPNTTIGEAISNVLKKYKYSLELMEVKMTNTLQVM